MNDFLAQAFRELKADRFRTLLSLLGVAIGIFSIVAALTLVDSLQAAIREGFDAYGGDVLFVDREPLEPDLNEDGVFRWWAYAARPPVSWRDYRFLRDNGERAFSRIAFAAYGPTATGVAGDWGLLVQQPLSAGRGFTDSELDGGAAVVVVGCEVESTVGDALWIDGARYEVIGVFAPAGAGSVSPLDIDRAQLVPFAAYRGPVLRGSILLAGADAALVRRLMRSHRRLPPSSPDDFSLNRLSFLLDEMNELFALAARLGWIIGIFSLLVGGIGIANMLFVSVEERRTQIGICRALGARRRTILGQFLGEAAVLSLLGGLSGIALAGLGVFGMRAWQAASSSAVGISLSLSLSACFTGVAVSLIIGLVFGAVPARAASLLPPAEAIEGK